MQPLAPDVLGISKTPWVFGQLVYSRRFFSKPDDLFFDIQGNLGKHLKWFDHAYGWLWCRLDLNLRIVINLNKIYYYLNISKIYIIEFKIEN